MNRRIGLIKQTILKRKFGGTFSHWIYNCFSPTCDILAKRKIEELVESGGAYYRVKIKEVEGYLYCSKMVTIKDIYQTIAEQLYEWQWHYYQIPETRIDVKDVILDCGSAEGIFTFLNRNIAKHIYAIEPLPAYISGLEKTFEDMKNVTVIRKALGKYCGTAFLSGLGKNANVTSEKTDIEIQIDTIDNICQTNSIRPTYIKADIEGYEMNLLEGAHAVIKANKPKIAITTYHGENHADEITEYLRSIVPEYKIITKGIEFQHGTPVMLHAF